MIDIKFREVASITVLCVELPGVDMAPLLNMIDDPRVAHIDKVSDSVSLLERLVHAGPHEVFILMGWNVGAGVARMIADLYPDNVVGFIELGNPFLPGGLLNNGRPLTRFNPVSHQWRFTASYEYDVWANTGTYDANAIEALYNDVTEMIDEYNLFPGNVKAEKFIRVASAVSQLAVFDATYELAASMTPGLYTTEMANAMTDLEDVQLKRVVIDE